MLGTEIIIERYNAQANTVGEVRYPVKDLRQDMHETLEMYFELECLGVAMMLSLDVSVDGDRRRISPD